MNGFSERFYKLFLQVEDGEIIARVERTDDLDDDLVKAVGKAARELGTSRSSFTRKALRSALEKLRMTAFERKHRTGYERKLVRRGEFDAWDNDQAWATHETWRGPVVQFQNNRPTQTRGCPDEDSP